MAPRLWLLVEWAEENNVFPSYEVVKINQFAYKDSELIPGAHIFINIHNATRRAKIIRISDNKCQVKEHKDFLERQDNQVKNVFQLCMRTIKELKSDQYPNSINSLELNTTTQQSTFLNVINAKSDDSDNSDSEICQNNITNFVNQTHQSIKYEPNNRKRGTQSLTEKQRRRSIVSSTPLPGKCPRENIKLYLDQGTQTDNDWDHIPTAKIEEIEIVLKHLYERFQSLVMKVSTTNGNELSESDPNGEICYAEPNDSWVPSIESENVETVNNIEENNVTIGDIVERQNNIVEAEQNDIKVPVKIESSRKNSNESTRVRRMSAQTTYSNEMVPIGNGHAIVPARLLNEIDWSSYTSATRQLLQAIFPRKILATHSLTGKQSPAHLNKPAKKLLDPNLVNDIIFTVSSKSGVPNSLVRNTITVKCTDEAKLFRNRQRYRFSRVEKNLHNDENVPPRLTHSSDESSHVVS